MPPQASSPVASSSCSAASPPSAGSAVAWMWRSTRERRRGHSASCGSGELAGCGRGASTSMARACGASATSMAGDCHAHSLAGTQCPASQKGSARIGWASRCVGGMQEGPAAAGSPIGRAARHDPHTSRSSVFAGASPPVPPNTRAMCKSSSAGRWSQAGSHSIWACTAQDTATQSERIPVVREGQWARGRAKWRTRGSRKRFGGDAVR